MTCGECVDCATKYTGRSWEIPVRCIECGGDIRSCDEFSQPDETESDKV